MWDWIMGHQFWSGIILMLFVTNAISAMPTPKDGSSTFYAWFFKFAQGIGGSIPRLLAIYSPQTLTAITGQEVKPTIPPDPPKTASQLAEATKP